MANDDGQSAVRDGLQEAQESARPGDHFAEHAPMLAAREPSNLNAAKLRQRETRCVRAAAVRPANFTLWQAASASTRRRDAGNAARLSTRSNVAGVDASRSSRSCATRQCKTISFARVVSTHAQVDAVTEHPTSCPRSRYGPASTRRACGARKAGRALKKTVSNSAAAIRISLLEVQTWSWRPPWALRGDIVNGRPELTHRGEALHRVEPVRSEFDSSYSCRGR